MTSSYLQAAAPFWLIEGRGVECAFSFGAHQPGSAPHRYALRSLLIEDNPARVSDALIVDEGFITRLKQQSDYEANKYKKRLLQSLISGLKVGNAIYIVDGHLLRVRGDLHEAAKQDIFMIHPLIHPTIADAAGFSVEKIRQSLVVAKLSERIAVEDPELLYLISNGGSRWVQTQDGRFIHEHRLQSYWHDHSHPLRPKSKEFSVLVQIEFDPDRFMARVVLTSDDWARLQHFGSFLATHKHGYRRFTKVSRFLDNLATVGYTLEVALDSNFEPALKDLLLRLRHFSI